MKLSVFGEKFVDKSGIVELMDDLGSALNENPDMIFMGGGNPHSSSRGGSCISKKTGKHCCKSPATP